MKNGRHDDSVPDSFASIAEGMSPTELEKKIKKSKNIDILTKTLSDNLTTEQLCELNSSIQEIIEERIKKENIERIVERTNKLSLSQVKKVHEAIDKIVANV